MTSFQEIIFRIVKQIPRKKLLTYKKVAKSAGNSQSYRAVGNILSKNTDSKIPCHRVIRSNGKIGGYKEGAKKKIYLLRKEGIIIKNGKIAS